jgi:anhydro-N-acetylmuramic acid kinase
MALIMGMNSGTSFDGIDVILAETSFAPDGHPHPPKFLLGTSYDWPEEVQNIVLDSFENKIDMIGLTRLHFVVGAVFAEAANKFLKEYKISPYDVDVLAVDGQTIYQEQPDHAKINKMTDEQKKDLIHRWLDGPYPCGYQLGETSIIAAHTNITTVTHFRPADNAFGGNGAPLMPYFDYVLFRHKDTPTLTLNIGGISNIHMAHKDRRKMVASDCGPGNVLVDHCARTLYNMSCDYDGKIAASGKVNEELLAELNDHPYFKRPKPRSGWRNDFSSEYGDSIMKKYSHLKGEDLMTTFCVYTAESIIRTIKEFVPQEDLDQCDVLYASGGGVKNPTMMRFIQERLPKNMRLTTSDEIGIPSQYKEAVKFATIAYSTINHVANNIPAACHASEFNILGKIAVAPRHAKGKGLLR